MNFTSLEFLILFPLVLMGYWWLPDKFRWIWTLVAGYGFYMIASPAMILLLWLITLVTYGCALGIEIRQKQGKSGKGYLYLAIFVCLGLLIIFKYFNFLLEIGFFCINLLINKNLVCPTVSIFLPIGISFYTFQSLSYVIDVYRGEMKAEHHLGYYALFVSYFPQLVAGPIERSGVLLNQLKQTQQINRLDKKMGMFRLLRGYFKKIVIADSLSHIVDVIFAVQDEIQGLTIVIGAVAFALQIYGDFSGYSDIAYGSARLMGIRLSENFACPYGAENIREFWRRWHITLTRWLTDYVYKPLGGNRKGVAKQCLYTMIVFLCSGLWHGAAWNFVFWGGLHGLYLCMEIGYRKWKESYPIATTNRKNPLGKWLAKLRTFALVCFAWIFFRADTLQDGFLMATRLWRGWRWEQMRESIQWLGVTWESVGFLFLALGVLYQFDTYNVECHKNEKEMHSFLAMIFVVFVIAMIWMAHLSQNLDNAFIYFQF